MKLHGWSAGVSVILIFLLWVSNTLLFVLESSIVSASPFGFDVRQHLASASRYGAGKAVDSVIKEEDPDIPVGCVPIHLNLVARHGTRGPTKKRIRELDVLVSRLRAQVGEQDGPSKNPKHPAWLQGYRSPWEGRAYGGELTAHGEEEMYQLGQRLQQRFPEIFEHKYNPNVYPITATQVPRAAASAVAFGMGLFEEKGVLGSAKHRAFSVVSDSRNHDIHLRFHESCVAYKDSKKLRKPSVQGLQDDVYQTVGVALAARYGLNLTVDDTASLWFLCKQEAAVLDITERACSLFNAGEVELLEWADDVELHQLKGYGEAINYKMGVPLLSDVLETMEVAIRSSEGGKAKGNFEAAKLRFAHAETVIPFTCLLGLFLERADAKSVQREEPLKPPSRPPHQRAWKGSLVAPFGANTALVLYKCPTKSGQSMEEAAFDYFVQVLHNEKPVSMLLCNGVQFCPFNDFKEQVVKPHLKHSFESLCTVQANHDTVQQSWAQFFVGIFRWPWESTSHHSETKFCRA